MKDEPRTRFKSWKCPYYGPLSLVPPPSKDGIRYIVLTEDWNRPVFFPYQRPLVGFDWMGN